MEDSHWPFWKHKKEKSAFMKRGQWEELKSCGNGVERSEESTWHEFTALRARVSALFYAVANVS